MHLCGRARVQVLTYRNQWRTLDTPILSLLLSPWRRSPLLNLKLLVLFGCFFFKARLPIIPLSLSLSLQTLELQAHAAMPNFYVGIGEPNSGPQACSVSVPSCFTSSPSPPPPSSFLNFLHKHRGSSFVCSNQGSVRCWSASFVLLGGYCLDSDSLFCYIPLSFCPSRSPLQGRDHSLLRPISHRLRAASPGPGAGPLGERTHRLPRPQHWGQCLNRVKGCLPSACPSSSRGRG